MLTPVANVPEHFHAVRFYKDASALCRIVGAFIGEGMAAGQPAVVIATPVHVHGLLECLANEQIDVERAQREGDLTILDAEETLASFMVDGMPDARRFKSAIIPVLERTARGRGDVTIRAYGEMVDVLWKAGQTAAATRLEMLWNDLARSHKFSLLCGYSMGSFYKDAAVEEICGHHSHVISETGAATPMLVS